MQQNSFFSLACLVCSLLGKTGYTAARCLTIGRNVYYLLNPNNTNYKKYL